MSSNNLRAKRAHAVTDDKPVYIYIILCSSIQMTFDPELMRILTSVMVMTFAFEDGKCTDQCCSSSWGSLEAAKVSFRGNC